MNGLCWRAGLCLALSSFGLAAETLRLNPVADTTLFETSPDNNLGGDSRLAVGTTAKGLKSRALLQFDLTNHLPAGSVITAVSLQFHVLKEADFGPKDSTFELRRVLVSWGEGTKTGLTGARADPGEATWKVRAAPDTLWTAPGGGNSDFAATPSARVPVGRPGPYTFPTTAELIADVSGWLEQSASNFGWVMLSQSGETSTTARRIGAREDSSNAPTLVIEYSGAPAGPRLTSLLIKEGRATLTWIGNAPGYQPQINEQLIAGGWVNFGPVLQTNTMEFTMTVPQAFFRVAALTNVPAAVESPP